MAGQARERRPTLARRGDPDPGRGGVPAPAGEAGLVYIRPAGTLRFRYRNDDEATDRAWRDDAFTVGDIGYLDADGYLFITDRVSDMVLWGGVNIAPAGNRGGALPAPGGGGLRRLRSTRRA